MAESSPNRWKTLWEKEKLLVTSNFSFSHSVFKRAVLQTRKNQGLFGKGLSLKPGASQCSNFSTKTKQGNQPTINCWVINTMKFSLEPELATVVYTVGVSGAVTSLIGTSPCRLTFYIKQRRKPADEETVISLESARTPMFLALQRQLKLKHRGIFGKNTEEQNRKHHKTLYYNMILSDAIDQDPTARCE